MTQMHAGIIRVLFATLLFFAPMAQGQQRSLPSANYPYPPAGVKIGQGWDSFNNQGTASSCVEVAEAKLERSTFETNLEHLQSTFGLITKTTTSVSGSYSGFYAREEGGKLLDGHEADLEGLVRMRWKVISDRPDRVGPVIRTAASFSGHSFDIEYFNDNGHSAFGGESARAARIAYYVAERDKAQKVLLDHFIKCDRSWRELQQSF